MKIRYFLVLLLLSSCLFGGAEAGFFKGFEEPEPTYDNVIEPTYDKVIKKEDATADTATTVADTGRAITAVEKAKKAIAAIDKEMDKIRESSLGKAPMEASLAPLRAARATALGTLKAAEAAKATATAFADMGRAIAKGARKAFFGIETFLSFKSVTFVNKTDGVAVLEFSPESEMLPVYLDVGQLRKVRVCVGPLGVRVRTKEYYKKRDCIRDAGDNEEKKSQCLVSYEKEVTRIDKLFPDYKFEKTVIEISIKDGKIELTEK